MIELPPSPLLRQLAGEVALEDGVHTYRCRSGESQFIKGVQHLLKADQATNVAEGNILATQGTRLRLCGSCAGVSGGIVATLALVKDLGGSRIGLLQPFYTYHIFQIKRIFGENVDVTYIHSNDSSSLFSPNWYAFALVRVSHVQGSD